MLMAERDQILAFRLSGHHVSERLPAGSLVAATRACGIRNTPPTSAILSLHARVVGVRSEDVAAAVDRGGSLVQVMAMRGSPFVVPAADAGVFTLGALPAGDVSLGAALGTVPMAPYRPAEALALAVAAIRKVLDGRVLAKPELSTAVSRFLPQELTPWCNACRAHHISESLWRLAGIAGAYCFAPRSGRHAALARLDQWVAIGTPGGEGARRELIRRYLRCYGPSTPRDFAAWAGVSEADATESWQHLGDDLVEVRLAGKPAWIDAADVAAFETPARATGVRLLPPNDSYLLLSDRATIVPNKALHKAFWRAIGNPGAVLVDGEVVASWRQRTRGKRLAIDVEIIRPLAPGRRPEIEAEAEALAGLLDLAGAAVSFVEGG